MFAVLTMWLPNQTLFYPIAVYVVHMHCPVLIGYYRVHMPIAERLCINIMSFEYNNGDWHFDKWTQVYVHTLYEYIMMGGGGAGGRSISYW